MLFSDEDKILINNLYQWKGHNARQLTEFQDNRWTTSSNSMLLKKFRDTGTVDRRQGSHRPRSARTDENIDQVKDMILSQQDQPRTYSTVREISRKTGIPRSSLVRSIQKDLHCSWNALRGDVRKSWHSRTTLLVSYVGRSFQTPFTRYNRLWNRLNVCLYDAAGCSTAVVKPHKQLNNRLNVSIHDTAGCSTGWIM